MEETNKTKEEVFRNPKNKILFNLAIWAGAASWLLLFFNILKAYFNLSILFLDGETRVMFAYKSFGENFSYFMSLASPFINALFIFFILQTLKELLFLMLDIRETIQPEESEQ